MDAAKVNVLPKVEEPSVSKKEVEYATFTTPATSIPAGTIGAYTGKETQPGFIPGYVRLGYGNYGNLDVLANYLFRLSDRDKLNVNFKWTEWTVRWICPSVIPENGTLSITVHGPM